MVLNGNRLEEFDYESSERSQLKGNIYLAKVTRVEPSLQAAFVEYGGNRHGFLPFSEIHYDYYRIPIADREALLAEQARLDEEAGGDEPNGEADPEVDADDPEAEVANAAGDAHEDEPAGEDGAVVHAQLTLGRGMFMLGEDRDNEYGATQKRPAEVGGFNTQSPYVVVGDLDAHHARAVAAGAEIVMPLEDQGYGRMYSCRDPEGHLWTFGDYDPWAPSPED